MQRPPQQAPDVLPHPCRQRLPVRLLLQNPAQNLWNRLPPKCPFPCQCFVQHTPKRPHVRPPVQRLAASLLRTHVRNCAQNRTRRSYPDHRRVLGHVAGPQIGLHYLGQPKVQDLDLSLRRDLDIGRFQIPVDDPLLMCRFQRFGHLTTDLQSLPHSQWVPFQPLRQRLPRNEFQDQIAHPIQLL